MGIYADEDLSKEKEKRDREYNTLQAIKGYKSPDPDCPFRRDPNAPEKLRRRVMLDADKYEVWDVDTFCNLMLDYSEHKESMDIPTFANRLGIPPKTFYTWVASNEKIKACYELTRSRIGSRRELEALYNRVNPNCVWKDHAFYSTEYRQQLEWESNLKVKEAASGPPIVVMDRFEDVKSVKQAPKITDETVPGSALTVAPAGPVTTGPDGEAGGEDE